MLRLNNKFCHMKILLWCMDGLLSYSKYLVYVRLIWVFYHIAHSLNWIYIRWYTYTFLYITLWLDWNLSVVAFATFICMFLQVWGRQLPFHLINMLYNIFRALFCISDVLKMSLECLYLNSLGKPLPYYSFNITLINRNGNILAFPRQTITVNIVRAH